MSNVEDLLGMCSKAAYLNAVAVGDGLSLTIDHLQIDSLKTPGGDSADKPVIYFQEDGRGWVMNITNLTILKAMFGGNTKGWEGKRLTLFNDTRIKVKQKDKSFRTGAIRIKSSPDIQGRLKIKAGGNGFAKPLEYIIEREVLVDPLLAALEVAGLTVEQYDRWAVSKSLPVFADTDADRKVRGAEWIANGGHVGIAEANTDAEPAR